MSVSISGKTKNRINIVVSFTSTFNSLFSKKYRIC